MNAIERANGIVRDIVENHLPRVVAGLQADPPYVDENQILVIYDHAVRARILQEESGIVKEALDSR